MQQVPANLKIGERVTYHCLFAKDPAERSVITGNTMKRIFIALIMTWVSLSYAQGEVVNNGIIHDDDNIIIIDVRTEKEYQDGHLKNAINIPYTEIKDRIKEYVTDKEEKIILYCRSGRRSGIAENILKEMGYKNVINAGAFEELRKKEESMKKLKE